MPLPDSAERAAALREAGHSLAQIAVKLNSEDVPTPSGRGRWTKSSVQYVLNRREQQRTGGD
ncbi:recombinase family protein [Dactylosporangium sp. AC04546]|uniref:recombinase family protein n=1 Tax=Dactylosporangium sp. AC04546 TaxID=2862460 RepID=UPI001EDFCF4D|nr:recombinase family protein [Dactylosporangium sp. AC04546]WVK80453.1 recombinase family protein [Dactylosporangium sp. AC04546]